MKLFDSLIFRYTIQILKKGNLINYIFGAIDILLLMITFQVSFYLMNPAGNRFLFFHDNDYLQLFIYMLPTWVLILHVCKIAQIPRTSRYSRLFMEYVQFTVLNFVFLYFFYWILGLKIPTAFITIFAVTGLIVLYGMRIVEYKVFRIYRANGYNFINLVIVADGSSEIFIEELLSRKEWGYRILMIFSDSKLLRAKFGNKVKILPERSVITLNNLLEFEIVDEVLYMKRQVKQDYVRKAIKSCEEVGVVFRVRSDISPVFLTSGQLSQIGNTSFLTFVNIPTGTFNLAFKNVMDTFASFFMIVLLSPVMIMIALAIAVSSPGPVIFRQARVGLRGRQFYLFKFRTMVVNAEALRVQLEKQNEMDGPVFKIKSDPRVTPIGRFLRKTGLDELPQLFNVLKGEMSLIGPRPPLQKEVRLYKRWQLRRLSVKPGITCSWQIIPDRNNVKFEHWMKLDLAYIDNWSPKLDFMLLLKTIRTVIFGTGA